ncbi:DUF3592 domain-containing protein [Streptomyces litmocidini]|uniref:DUF3592 domain-containing protein n=1 Tax=Streptomyces litmocidini TaxID=67318 RepID=UPI0037032D65
MVMVGALIMAVGGFALFVTIGNVLLWSKMRKLRRHGVQGEAVSVLHDWMEGKHRVHYRVILPDPDENRQFYETQVKEPEPIGSVAAVVYDRRRPTRAIVGTMEKVDAIHRSEGGVVKFVWAFGLSTILLGRALVALFS